MTDRPREWCRQTHRQRTDRYQYSRMISAPAHLQQGFITNPPAPPETEPTPSSAMSLLHTGYLLQPPCHRVGCSGHPGPESSQLSDLAGLFHFLLLSPSGPWDKWGPLCTHHASKKAKGKADFCPLHLKEASIPSPLNGENWKVRCKRALRTPKDEQEDPL